MATKNKADHYWYARNPSKFRRKTSHLSLMEVGAYDRLLDWYYENRRPLSDNWVHLHRICSAVAPDEQDAVQSVVQEFFKLHDDGWHNTTADEEIAKSAEISQKRADAQAEKERKRVAKQGANAPALAPANAPTTTTTTTDSISNDIESDMHALSSLEIDMMFQNVWNAYPSRGKDGAAGNGYKGSRSKAFESFSKLLKKTPKEEHENLIANIRTGSEQYEKHLVRSGYPCQHASTWLNQRGWEDDYSSNGAAAAGRSGGKHERARAILTEDDSTIIEG